MRRQSLVLGLLPLLASCSDHREDLLVYPYPTVLEPAVTAEVLFDELAMTMEGRQTNLYEGLLSPSFTFVDEIGPEPIRLSRSQELALVAQLLRSSRAVEFTLHVVTESDTAHGCRAFHGRLEVTLGLDKHTRHTVTDHVCITACQAMEDGLWRLAQWRTDAHGPPTRADSTGYLSWGDMKLKLGVPQ